MLFRSVHKIDRFSRNLVVTFQALARIERAGATFASVTEHMDMTTPHGRMLLGMIAVFAQYFSDNLGTEVSKGRAERARAGLQNGDLPFGYVSTGNAKEPPVVVEREGELVREVFRRYAEGRTSAHEIAAWLNAEGARPRSKRGITMFTKATVTDMLSNPFYVGRVRYRGEEMPGAHPPIVDQALFEACQEAKRSRRKNPAGNKAHPAHIYLLRGIARCAKCGGALWCSPEPIGLRYRDTANLKQRACSNKRASVMASTIDTQIGALIRKLQLPPEWREEVLRLAATFRAKLDASPLFGVARTEECFAIGPLRAGRLHGLELKSCAGRLSVAQQGYRDALLAAGGDYVVARTLDDVAFALAGWGVPLRCRLLPFLAADAARAERRRRAA